MSTNKLEFNLKLDGWWGDTSVLINKECVLSKIKDMAINKMLQNKIIEEKDIDSRNKVSHIQITNRNYPRDNNKYNAFNERKISITFNDIQVNRDFIEVQLPERTHMTIFYKKSINGKKTEILKLLRDIFDTACNEKSNSVN